MVSTPPIAPCVASFSAVGKVGQAGEGETAWRILMSLSKVRTLELLVTMTKANSVQVGPPGVTALDHRTCSCYDGQRLQGKAKAKLVAELIPSGRFVCGGSLYAATRHHNPLRPIACQTGVCCRLFLRV
jgi:hypothetical protein